jgi:hypothetical protein
MQRKEKTTLEEKTRKGKTLSIEKKMFETDLVDKQKKERKR